MVIRKATAGLAAALGLAMLAGCPGAAPTTGTAGGTDFNPAGGINPGGVTSTPFKPAATATPDPGSATPTPTPNGQATPTPAPTPTGPRQVTVTILNPISQMWLPQSINDKPPGSIPSTHQFRVEVAVRQGTQVATSSAVSWTSSKPQFLSIDSSGFASASVLPGVNTSQQILLTAATAGVSTPLEVLVGNSGLIEIEVE